MAKRAEITAVGTVVITRNERERGLVRITNRQIERIIEDWATGKNGWDKSFEREGADHWRIVDIDGALTSMYYLEMINEPVNRLDLYDSIEIAVNNRR